MKRGFWIAATFGAALSLPTVASAGDITGMWLVQDGSAKIRIANCGSAFCGTIAWIKDPNDPETGKPWTDKQNVNASQRSRPLLGVAVASNMTPAGPDKWRGKVYSVDHGRTVDGSLTLVSARQLKIEGCMLMICDGETWTKAD